MTILFYPETFQQYPWATAEVIVPKVVSRLSSGFEEAYLAYQLESEQADKDLIVGLPPISEDHEYLREEA